MKITNIMLANRFGGIGQAYLDYNEALLTRGHNVQAICHRHSSWFDDTREQLAKFPGLSMATVSYKGGPLSLLSILAIRRKVSAFRPDIIFIHNYRSMTLAACRGLAPLATVSHMYKTKHFEKFDLVIAMTNELSNMCVDEGVDPHKIKIIPNFIKGPFNSPERFESSSVTIGSLGRLDIEKGYSYLVDACHLLKERGVAFKCVIGGAGNEEQNLKEMANRLGLNNDIDFVGLVTDKTAFFDKIDLFIVPSTSETFGITVLESMKFGRPIIASNRGGPAEILSHDHTALLAEPASPPSFADAIEELANNPDKAFTLATNASRVLQEKYTIEVVGESLSQAIQEQLAPHA